MPEENQFEVPIYLRNKENPFYLGKYLKSQNMELLDVSGKGGLYNRTFNPADFTFKVRDKQTGKEGDFDAYSFLEKNDLLPDFQKTHDNYKENFLKASREQREKDIQLKLDKLKDPERSLAGEVIFPGTSQLLEKSLESGEMPSALRRSISSGAGAVSTINRSAVGLLEDIAYEVTDKKMGQPLLTSMMDVPEYGVDEGKNEELGMVEALAENWEDFKTAMQFDPTGTMKALVRESARDPLTGVSILATVGASLAGTPLAGAAVGSILMGSRAPKILANTVKATKKVTESLKQSRVARTTAKMKTALDKASMPKKIAYHVSKEGIQGGSQGVLLKWAYGADDVGWNDFIVEGVEEAVFGSIIRGGIKGSGALLDVSKNQWKKMSKAERAAEFNETREAAQNVKKMKEAGTADAAYEKGQQAQEMSEAAADDGEFSEAFKELIGENPEIKPMTKKEMAVHDAIKEDGVSPIIMREVPDDVNSTPYTYTIVKDSDGNSETVPLTLPLPPGVSRKEAVNNLKDPSRETRAKQVKREIRQKQKDAIKADLKDLIKKDKDYNTEVVEGISNVIKEVESDINKEDELMVKTSRELSEQAEKDLNEISDPTKTTSFDTWKRVFGDSENPLSDADNYREFHKNEAKKIKKLNEEINPKEEKSGGDKSDKPFKKPKKTIKRKDDSYTTIEQENIDPPPSLPTGDGEVTTQGDENVERDNAIRDDAGEVQRSESGGGGAFEAEPAIQEDGEVSGEPSDGIDGGNPTELTPERRGDSREVASETVNEPDEPDIDDAINNYEGESAPSLEVKEDDSPKKNLNSVKKNLNLRNLDPVELTPAKRREANKRAIEVLNRIKTDPTSVTEADRDILRQYTGIGGIEAATKTDEKSEALHGIRYEFYTSYTLSEKIWDIIDSLGFNLSKKTALEPTSGIGNFIGFAPRGVKWFANEVSETAGDILKILYPESNNRIGAFEDYLGPNVDLTVTNVPFLKGRGRFSHLEKSKSYENISSLHNYVIMKSIDHLRDNGLGVFITSTGTMDSKTGRQFREDLNLKAEVIAALRLPEGAFSKNTQFKGSSDILFLRKRTHGELEKPLKERLQPDFVETKEVDLPSGEKTSVSKWFDANPKEMLGDEIVYGHGFGPGQVGVSIAVGESGFDSALRAKLNTAADELKGKYKSAPGAMSDSAEDVFGKSIGPASAETPVLGFETKSGKVYKKGRDGQLYPFRDPEKKYDIPDKAFQLITEVMERIPRLMNGISESRDVSVLQSEIKERLEEYRTLSYKRQPYVGSSKKKTHLFPGVNKKTNVDEVDGKKRRTVSGLKFGHKALDAYLHNDYRYWNLASLYDEKMTGFSRFLSGKTQMSKSEKVEKGDLKKSSGVVDYVRKKFGRFTEAEARRAWEGSAEEFEQSMSSHEDLIFDGDQWYHMEDYATGDLWDKIDSAKKRGDLSGEEKLRKFLPKQKTAKTLDKSPTGTWWDFEALDAFAQNRLGMSPNMHIKRVADESGDYKYRLFNGDKPVSFSKSSTSADPIGLFITSTLNQDVLTKKIKNPITGKDVTVKDPGKTKEFRENSKKMFSNWANREGLEYSGKAAEKFNRTYMGASTRKISESPFYIEGFDTHNLGLYPSQYSAVRRGLISSSYILAHAVGYGKTFGMMLTFQSLKNAGRVRKAVFTVPDTNLPMWKREFDTRLPGIRVKAIRGGDHKTRVPDLNDAAANDYDVILVSHTAFSTVPMKASVGYIESDIKKYSDLIHALKHKEADESGKKTNTDAFRKRLENKIDNLNKKLRSTIDGVNDPGIPNLEDWDVDAIFADEAHNYKNYFEPVFEYEGKSFLSVNADSNLGNDFQQKTRMINEKNGGGGVFIATATPTPNKVIEIYKMLKLVAPFELEKRGLNTIDDFVRDFVDIGYEETAGIDSTGSKTVEKMVGIRNADALRDMVKTYSDVRMTPSPEIMKSRPKHSENMIVEDMSDAQLNEMARLIVLSKKSKKELQDLGYSPLIVTGEARRLAVDPGQVNKGLIKEFPNPFERSSKLKNVMKNVEMFFKKNDRLQLVFLDSYNVYDVVPYKNPFTNDRMKWPSGWGAIANNKGEKILPGWVKREAYSDNEYVSLERRALREEVDFENLPKNRAGNPIDFNKTANQWRPIFEDGEIYIGRRVPVQNLHEEIKKYAIEKIGIPRNRVAIVNGNSNNKPEEKNLLERRVLEKELSLLIGERGALGVGLNLQTNGDAIHQVDSPWNPMPLDQANGRFLRSRKDLNDKHKVTINYYASKGSLDTYLYETVGDKKRWQEGVWDGKGDYIDLSMEADENSGIDFKTLSKNMQISKDYLDGNMLQASIFGDESKIKSQRKELSKIKNDVSRIRKKIDEHKSYVERAEKRIADRLQKFNEEKSKGEDVEAPNNDNDNQTITSHGRSINDLLSSLDENTEKAQVYKDVDLLESTNRIAKNILPDLKANKWKNVSFGKRKKVEANLTDSQIRGVEEHNSKLDESERKLREFLKASIPVIADNYPDMSTMIYHKINGNKIDFSRESAKKIQEYVDSKTPDDVQSGKASLETLLGIPLVGWTIASRDPTLLLGYGMFKFAFSRFNPFWEAPKADIKNIITSVEKRLEEYPGFKILQPAFKQAHNKVQHTVNSRLSAFYDNYKGIREEEFSTVIPDLIENPDLEVEATPAARKMVEFLRDGIFGKFSDEASSVGIGITRNDRYYPKKPKVEMLEEIQNDPETKQRVVDSWKAQGFKESEIFAMIEKMWDGSEEMKLKRSAKKKEEMYNWALEQSGGNATAFKIIIDKIDGKFRGQTFGHFMGRRIPDLPSDFYHRDIRDVVPSYIYGAGRATVYRAKFGEDLSSINEFLDGLSGIKSEDEIEQAREWIYAELYGRTLSSKSSLVTPEISRRAKEASYISKLAWSVPAGIKNSMITAHNSITFAGLRATARGTLDSMAQIISGKGYSKARIAGAVLDKTIFDTVGLMNGELSKRETNVFKKLLKSGGFHAPVEKMTAFLSYNSGRYYGSRLFHESINGNEKSRETLTDIIGSGEYSEARKSGKLSETALEIVGLHFSQENRGIPRIFNTPAFSSTDWGSTLTQFRRTAFVITKKLKDEVYIPAKKGDMKPFARYLLGMGLTWPATKYLLDIAYFWRDDEEDEPESIREQVFDLVETATHLQYLGLWGDVALSTENRTQFGKAPFVGSLVGPNYGSMAFIANDAVQGLFQGDYLGEERWWDGRIGRRLEKEITPLRHAVRGIEKITE